MSYLVSPYNNPKNVWVDPGTDIPAFADNAIDAVSELDNIKLHNYQISKDITGGTVLVQTNNCHITKYFLSSTNDVFLNWRPDIGGFFDLRFLNHEHTFSAQTHDSLPAETEPGKAIDLTQSILDFKTVFDVNNDFYLYFFCPFMKAGADDTKFAVKFDLNASPVDPSKVVVKTKEQIQREMRLANSGRPVEATSTVPKALPATMKEKLDRIMTQIKGSSSMDGIASRIEQSPSEYYPVIQRDLSLKVGKADAPGVEKVGHAADGRCSYCPH